MFYSFTRIDVAHKRWVHFYRDHEKAMKAYLWYRSLIITATISPLKKTIGALSRERIVELTSNLTIYLEDLKK